MDTATRLPSLDHRLNKKVVIHSDKIRRLSAHPVSQHLEEPTKATTTKIPNKPKRNKANKQTNKKKPTQIEENQLQPPCQASCQHPIARPCRMPSKRVSHLLMLMTGDA